MEGAGDQQRLVFEHYGCIRVVSGTKCPQSWWCWGSIPIQSLCLGKFFTIIQLKNISDREIVHHFPRNRGENKKNSWNHHLVASLDPEHPDWNEFQNRSKCLPLPHEGFQKGSTNFLLPPNDKNSKIHEPAPWNQEWHGGTSVTGQNNLSFKSIYI